MNSNYRIFMSFISYSIFPTFPDRNSQSTKPDCRASKHRIRLLHHSLSSRLACDTICERHVFDQTTGFQSNDTYLIERQVFDSRLREVQDILLLEEYVIVSFIATEDIVVKEEYIIAGEVHFLVYGVLL
ncbi:hypothetical protein X798_04678 [Onchocerca flexuosa]|uniref:Uncharacterized protein n=1 Tax=Onchocerca flexuosa TaxID=387005 RepID=A0A238BTU9_9BILA|nr:hypothetical protein X798_04678 [Onchocerca flexuosa]